MKIITATLAVGVFCTVATTSSIVLALDLKTPKVATPQAVGPHPKTGVKNNQGNSSSNNSAVCNGYLCSGTSSPTTTSPTTYTDQGGSRPLGNALGNAGKIGN